MQHLIARGLVLFLFTIAASQAFAGYGRGGGSRGGGGSGGGSQSAPPATTPPPPPIDRSASTKARQDVNTATAEVDRATTALNTLTIQFRKQKLEPTDEWKSLHEALVTAQKNYDDARAAAIKALKSDTGYQAAIAERNKAKTDRENFQADTPIEERARVAKAVLTTTDAVATMETAALANNDAVAKAKASLDAATAKMNQLLASFDATLTADPTYAAASKSADEAKQKLADAKKSLADALTHEAQAERDRQKSMASTR